MVSLCQPAEIEPVDTSAVSLTANEHGHIAVFPRLSGLFLPFFQDFDAGIVAGVGIERQEAHRLISSQYASREMMSVSVEPTGLCLESCRNLVIICRKLIYAM